MDKLATGIEAMQCAFISLTHTHTCTAMERKKEDEDYGDYVTRCICDFKHDDGYMIQCDGCRYVCVCG